MIESEAKIKYFTFIDNKRVLDRSKNNGRYYEWHHIIPKCVGGSDDESNFVLLTPREHFMAHKYLIDCYSGKDKAKLVYALNCMHMNNQNQKRNNKLVSSYRKYIKGENHPGYGKNPFTDEQIDEIRKRMTENNPMKGKIPWNKGLTSKTSIKVRKITKRMKETKRLNPQIGREKSIEERNKISKSMIGKTKSEEHKKKLSLANLGKKLSDETRMRMSNSKKGIEPKTIICPHCNKIGKGSAMYRWHFDNCKGDKL